MSRVKLLALHVRREDEKIQIADKLVNEAIDAKVKGR
jgi:hypothetical protein